MGRLDLGFDPLSPVPAHIAEDAFSLVELIV